jgi:Rps23 Pro-64 3,4-dihydroxylase Tpa1-like proline 4-hydroxylase
MQIDTNQKPFPFLLIHNFYNQYELDLIWQELDFLSYSHKFDDGKKSNDRLSSDGKYEKQCKAIYLDDVYANRNISNILSVNRKLFTEQILTEFCKINFAYKSISHCKNDYTMINYYENSDYYKPHSDNYMYSALTWLYREPKKFSGGEFNFVDYNYTIEPLNNTLILFPSFVSHSVNAICLDNIHTNKNYGRYSIAQFVN